MSHSTARGALALLLLASGIGGASAHAAAAPRASSPRTRAPAPAAPAAAPAPKPAPVQLEMPPPPAALAAPARPAPAPAERLLRVAVLDVQVLGEVPERALAAFSQALAPEVRKLTAVSALSSGEVREMLSVERQKALMGCSETSAECLAEIAGALDVDELIGVELTLQADTYVLTARRTDTRRGQVVQGFTRRFEKRDGEELLAQVGAVVAELYPERPLKAGRQRGVEAALVRRVNPPPLPRWSTLGTGGLSAAALGAGALFGVLSLQAGAEVQALGQQALSQPVPGSLVLSAQDRLRRQATTANVLMATGGALALATLVQSLFTDWSDDRAALLPPAVAPTVTPAVAPGSAGVALSGRF